MGGKVAGWATRVSGVQTITNLKVKALGNIDAQDIVPTDRDVSFTCGFVRIVKESLQIQGIWPRGGTVEILKWPFMTAELFDRIGDESLYRFTGVRAANRTFTCDQGGILMLDTSWDAIRLADEISP